MSEIITDAAIEAATIAIREQSDERWGDMAQAALTAALPHMEAAIRERVFAEPVAESNLPGIPDRSIGGSHLVRNMHAIQDVLAMSDEDVRETGRKTQALGDDIPAVPAPEDTAAPVGEDDPVITSGGNLTISGRGFSIRPAGSGVRFHIDNQKSEVVLDRQTVEEVARSLVERMRELAFVHPESSFMVDALSEFERLHGRGGGVEWYEVAPLRFERREDPPPAPEGTAAPVGEDEHGSGHTALKNTGMIPKILNTQFAAPEDIDLDQIRKKSYEAGHAEGLRAASWNLERLIDAWKPHAPAVADDVLEPPEPEHLRHDSPEQHCWMDGWDIGYRAALTVADARLDDCVEQVDRVSDDIVTWATRVMAVEQTTDALRRDVESLTDKLNFLYANTDTRLFVLESRERPESLTIEIMGAMLAAACQAEPLINESRVESIIRAALAAKGSDT